MPLQPDWIAFVDELQKVGATSAMAAITAAAARDVSDEGGPLRRGRVGQRKTELARLFARLRSEHPDASAVRGTSWLYHLEAYCRLFPDAYVLSRRVQTSPNLHFTGGSSWGQFLDHKGRLRRSQADVFYRNLDSLDPQAVWKCFPLPAMIVEAPVAAFYDEFGI